MNDQQHLQHRGGLAWAILGLLRDNLSMNTQQLTSSPLLRASSLAQIQAAIDYLVQRGLVENTSKAGEPPAFRATAVGMQAVQPNRRPA